VEKKEKREKGGRKFGLCGLRAQTFRRSKKRTIDADASFLAMLAGRTKEGRRREKEGGRRPPPRLVRRRDLEKRGRLVDAAS